MSMQLRNFLGEKGYEYITQVELYHGCTFNYRYAVGPRIDPYTGGVKMEYRNLASGITRYTEFFTAKKNGKIDFCKCDYYVQDDDKKFFSEKLEVLIKDSGNLLKNIYVTRSNGSNTNMVRFAMFEGNKNIMGYNFCESSVRRFDNTKFVDWYDYNEILSLTDGKLFVFELDIPKDNGYRTDGKNICLGNVYLKQKNVVFDENKITHCQKIDTAIHDGWESCKDSLNEKIYLMKTSGNKYRIFVITRDHKIVMSDLYDKLKLTQKYILPPLTMEGQDPESSYAYPDTGLVFNYVKGSENGEFIIDDKLNQYHRNCSKLVLKKSTQTEEK